MSYRIRFIDPRSANAALMGNPNQNGQNYQEEVYDCGVGGLTLQQAESIAAWIKRKTAIEPE